MVELAHKKCIPCEEGASPLEGERIEKLLSELREGWSVANEHHLTKEFSFKDFKQALAFTNQVGSVAEKENHHPDIHLAWGKVRIVLWTHKINGLSDSDFILAAKIDQLSMS